jgi:cardiolipin synthase
VDLINILLHGTVALDVFGWVVRIVALIVVPTNRRPSSAMAWLLTIFLVPYFGLIAFLLIGNPKLPRARREKQRQVNSRILELTAGLTDLPTGGDPGPHWLEQLVALNRNLGAMPMVTGNEARLLGDYDGALQSMTDAVAASKHFVHCQFYILAFDETTAPFFKALEEAVERGVSVRVLLDHIGSLRSPHYRKTIRELKRIGVDWHLALPVQPYRGRYQRPDLRNHRKLLVIDGDVGFIGSQNLIDRSYNKRGNLRRGLLWQELMARLEGPIVGGINALFLTDWFSETNEVLDTEIDPTELRVVEAAGLACQVVPSGPGFDGENNLKLFNSLLYNAERRISITSPYFVPDESLLAAVTTAAQRGVDVELFVSAIGDQPFVFHAQRSYYEALLRAGVRIYLYPAPYILHAKHLTIDEDVSVIGSSNMDIRSFELNLEATLLVSGVAFADDLRAVQDQYREVSHELTLEEHNARGLPRKVIDNVARLTSALQ